MKKFILAMGLMLGMAFCTFAQTDKTLEEYDAALLKAGVAAPDFSLQTPEGKILTLKDFKGKYLLLDFWAIWCSDCVAALPQMKEAYRRFGKDVAFLGVSLDDNRENWIKGIDEHKLEYLQGTEMKKWRRTDIAPAYAIDWIPTVYIIGKDGKVILGTTDMSKAVRKLSELTGK